MVQISKVVQISRPAAVLVGMLPKDFQDVALQVTTCMTKEVIGGYPQLPDLVASLANQKVQLVKPTPMDFGGVEAIFTTVKLNVNVSTLFTSTVSPLNILVFSSSSAL